MISTVDGFFSWGYKWPENNCVPAENLEQQQNGIHWYRTEAEARADMRDALRWFDHDDGGYNPRERDTFEWPEG
ncbi:MAG: hypothetical protein H0Z39_02525 [Peptococcaceae bacterium]|nr:hypothetical protein [Peptococcaceae bacterium]